MSVFLFNCPFRCTVGIVIRDDQLSLPNEHQSSAETSGFLSGVRGPRTFFFYSDGLALKSRQREGAERESGGEGQGRLNREWRVGENECPGK